MILILHHLTDDKRLRYAADFLFDGFSEQVEWTNQMEFWEEFAGPKLIYGREGKGRMHSLVQHLWDEDTIIYPVQLQGLDQGIPQLHHAKDGLLDPFALAFWSLTRIEEYQSFAPDQHGRFTAQHTAVGEARRTPWLDRLRQRFQSEWCAEFPNAKARGCEVNYELTIDVDAAYAYRNKPIWRTCGALARDLFTGRLSEFQSRWRVLMNGSVTDPYDTYEMIRNQSEGWTRKWFFLLGNRRDGDLNIHHRESALNKVIREVAQWDEVGIHPGYATHQSYPRYEEQVQRIANIIGAAPKIARQHYLRFRLPDTYRIAVQCGIEREYSMGFADDVGFRAGTASPFPWFDVLRNESTDLSIVPFCAMDATLRFHLKQQPEQAVQTLAALHSQVSEVGGTFGILWHNESISEHGLWKGWKPVFEAVVKLNR